MIFRSPAAVPGTPLGVPLHPTQIYASLVEFVLFVFLLWLLHRPHHDGEILGAWLFLGGLSSFLLTFLRGDGCRGLIPSRNWWRGDGARGRPLVAASPLRPRSPMADDEPQLRQLTSPKKPTDSVWISFSPSN